MNNQGKEQRKAVGARGFSRNAHIVSASDLEQYANSRASQDVIPELIRRLVKQSVSKLYEIRIPYGDAVNQRGWDGIVEAESAFTEFVPDGRSYWEIGTGNDPQTKATKDFKKRTSQLSADDRAQGSFVFVTPRFAGWGEPEQTRWLERRKDKGWKDIRIIDGVKLADWLREFPYEGRWMASKLGRGGLGGIRTPTEHWEDIVDLTKPEPPIPPTLFTEGCGQACDALRRLFAGDLQRLFLLEGEQDVADFVAAYIETLDEDTARDYASRCLYINEEEAWLGFVGLRARHVLVADPRLSLDSDERSHLQREAMRNGHAVIIPLRGVYRTRKSEIIKLQSPARSQIKKVLREAGYSYGRSCELGRIGGNRLSALLRHLRGPVSMPPYTTWKTARFMAQAGLAGKWDGKSAADREALGRLWGKEYGERIKSLREDSIRSDSPLIQSGETWRFFGRWEAWDSLGNRITDDDLDRLEEVAVAVLGERDPRFEAILSGKRLKHSSMLREGLAETLVLVGSRSEALSECSFDKRRRVAVCAVRKLLEGAGWDMWASLDSQLPMLAEADPNKFLDAVELGLVDLAQSPFREVFAQESSGRTYMIGLLRALETLAWHSDFLSRVAVILADLATLDPGGNCTTRPINSLFDIFLPWHVQTSACVEKRKVAVQNVLQEHLNIGWQLILGLLPNQRTYTTGSRQPTWRDYIPRDWKPGVSEAEYWEQIKNYTDLALEIAKTSAERLGELIECMPGMPNPAFDNLLERLASEEVVSLPESERCLLWEKLDGIVRRHRKYADARWAMPEGDIARIESVASDLAPEAPPLKYHYLFEETFNLFPDTGNYEEQQKRLARSRQNAVRKIFEAGGVSAVLDFARSVSPPGNVGYAVGSGGKEDMEEAILPSLLDAEDEIDKAVVAEFVWGRFQKRGWDWVDSVLGKDWNDARKNAFLMLLPFEEGVWRRIEEHLGKEKERIYWEKVDVPLFCPKQDLTLAIEKLIEYGRVFEAVHCVCCAVNDRERIEEALAIRVLLAVGDMPDAYDRLRQYRTARIVSLIKRLQESSGVDPKVLSKIEWHFLSFLDRYSEGSPVTLESRLALDPAYFAKIIALAYRSKNEPEIVAEPSKERKAQGMNAYMLLDAWKKCPGKISEDSFDEEKFKFWLKEAKRITEETGHSEIAQERIGHVLTNAPSDPDGLWIRRAVAEALNARDADGMRTGFTIEIFNQRGGHSFTAGREERELAQRNREKAEALKAAGYSRFATAMRELANIYDQDAEREALRTPFEE